MKKIERIGINSFMANPSPLTSGIYTRPSLSSPMAQLTCLLPSGEKDGDDVALEKPPRSQLNVRKSPSPASQGTYLTINRSRLFRNDFSVIIVNRL